MRIIKLACGKETLVDDSDFDALNAYRWCANGHGYVHTYAGNNKWILMHRAILQAPKGVLVDHENGNILDNRRQNLRLCNRTQNVGNSKKMKRGNNKYKGASWSKRDKKWNAYIGRPNGSHKYLGGYDNEIDAALAYDKAAKEYFGEFARLNFPEEGAKCSD